MSTYFYVIRHGESEGNVNGDIIGTNPPLTKKGIDQAELLADLLNSIDITEIHTSNLARASHTAKIIAKKKGIPAIKTPHLRERHFGALEGLTGKEMMEMHGERYNLFTSLSGKEQLLFKIVDNMESLHETLARVLKYLTSVAGAVTKKNVLVVTHANVMLSLLVHLKFASFNQLPYGSIKNTGYIKIKHSNNKLSLVDVYGITKKVSY
jgi:broad specificity phosphatase PhoE